MKKYLLGVLLLAAPITIALANCDLTQFRWPCEMPVQPKPSRGALSVIDCDGTNVYVTKAEYEEIMRYQRASVFLTMKVNGEWVSSPCVPAGYQDPTAKQPRKVKWKRR